MKKRALVFFKSNSTQKSLTALKSSIAAKVEEDVEWRKKLDEVKDDKGALFEMFLDAAKKNDFLTLGYILNYCFEDAVSRANFGNRQDALGNTAYHIAAMNDCADVIVLLNDKSEFNGKKKFISFAKKNKAGLKPLDICCQNGHQAAFNAMWKRVNKPQHNPASAYEYALEGGNQSIIAALETHVKVKRLNLGGKK